MIVQDWSARRRQQHCPKHGAVVHCEWDCRGMAVVSVATFDCGADGFIRHFRTAPSLRTCKPGPGNGADRSTRETESLRHVEGADCRKCQTAQDLERGTARGLEGDTCRRWMESPTTVFNSPRYSRVFSSSAGECRGAGCGFVRVGHVALCDNSMRAMAWAMFLIPRACSSLLAAIWLTIWAAGDWWPLPRRRCGPGPPVTPLLTSARVFSMVALLCGRLRRRAGPASGPRRPLR